METSTSSPSETSPLPSTNDLKGLLAEARSTRDVLDEFCRAIENGSFPGSSMMAVAKGVAFLSAIRAQTKAHVDNLQRRIETEHGN